MSPRRGSVSTRGDAAQRQFTESNNTFHTFLGGARRPSWLTEGPGSDQTRRRSSQASLQQASLQQAPPQRSDVESQQPLTSAATTSRSSPDTLNQAEVAVLQAAPPPSAAFLPHPSPVATAVSPTSFHPSHADGQAPASGEIARKRGEGPAILETSPKRAHRRHISAENTLDMSVLGARSQEVRRHSGPSPILDNSQSPPQAFSHPHAGHLSRTQSYRQQMVARPAVVRSQASSPSANHYPSPVSQQSWTHMPPPPQVRRQTQSHIGQPPPVPALEPYSGRVCLPLIERFLNDRKSAVSAASDQVEFGRLDLLRQAAIHDDSLYLFVHQIVSQYANNEPLPHIIRNTPGFTEAATILNTLLAGNLLKDHAVLVFCTHLPRPVAMTAVENPGTYQILFNYIKHVGAMLPNGWEQLKSVCVGRGYPPTPAEMWRLTLCSPTLMNLFFSAALRQIWPTNNEYAFSLFDFAKQVFEEHRQALFGAAQGYSIPVETLQRFGEECQFRFRQLPQQYEQFCHRQMQMAGPPFHSLNGSSSSMHIGSAQRVLPSQTRVNQTPQQSHEEPPDTVQSANLENVNNMRAHRRHQQDGPLIPPHNARRPEQPANPTWHLSALHQANLRSPRFSNDMADTPASEKLYQYVYTYAITPKRLEPAQVIQVTGFTIPSAERIAQTTDPVDGQRKVRQLDEGARQFRLRMVKVDNATASLSETEDLTFDWCLKPTRWPSDFYFQLNQQMLEPRKKQHHTKDMPIDITEYAKNDQENMLEIFLNVDPNDPKIAQYAYAVEVVRAIRHDKIIQECEGRTISSEESLKAIVASLKRSTTAGDDNDDMIIDSARTNITIFDPISQSQICPMPARGKGCKHRECFDLLTFLSSRPRERPSWPSDPDAWKCPICLADVRPPNIIIDGFLKEVRDKLIAQNMSKVRTIVVDSDGSWVPKIEERSASARSTPENTGPAPAVAPVDAADSMSNASDVTKASSPVNAHPAGVLSAALSKNKVVVDLSMDD